MKDYSKMTEGEALRSIGVRASERDGIQGLELDLKNKKALFIPASDEKPKTIVASEYRDSWVKGVKEVECHECKQIVGISPSTQQVLKKYPDTPVICIACMIKQVEKEAADGQRKDT